MLVKTDLRTLRESARAIRFYPVPGIDATNVQDAIEDVATGGGGTSPPSLTPTAVNAAMSPYAVLPTDYLILVDCSGGAVVLTMGLAALRSNRAVTIKDDSGDSAANNITINATAPDTIDEAASYVLATNFDAITLNPKPAGYTAT